MHRVLKKRYSKVITAPMLLVMEATAPVPALTEAGRFGRGGSQPVHDGQEGGVHHHEEAEDAKKDVGNTPEPTLCDSFVM